MKVTIHDHYSDVSRSFEGTRAVVYAELLRNYPWLHDDPDMPHDVEGLVDTLDNSQAFEAEIEDLGDSSTLTKAESNLASREIRPDSPHVLDQLGHNHNLMSTFDAARHLVRGNEPSLDQVRKALWEADGDVERAALHAHGIEPSEGNLRALRAVRDITSHKKGEPQTVTARDVQPGTPDASEFAAAVGRAFSDRFVFPVEMDGKHSKGTLLARDVEGGDVFLLKPGSGGDSPAAGVAEEMASQSRRESGFWAVVDAWGIGNNYPEAHLVLVDGKEYAALKLLPWRYKTVDKELKNDPALGRRLLEPYLNSGLLFRWAVADFVLGNPDRHANNLMSDSEDPPGRADVKLIDQGSAMAGNDFDPAHDQNSFVPYYLRAWAPIAFNRLTTDEKVHVMPRLSSHGEADLRGWIDNIHADELQLILVRFGINPEPALARLAKLKALSAEFPSDEAVDKIWVTT